MKNKERFALNNSIQNVLMLLNNSLQNVLMLLKNSLQNVLIFRVRMVSNLRPIIFSSTREEVHKFALLRENNINNYLVLRIWYCCILAYVVRLQHQWTKENRQRDRNTPLKKQQL